MHQYEFCLRMAIGMPRDECGCLGMIVMLNAIKGYNHTLTDT